MNTESNASDQHSCDLSSINLPSHHVTKIESNAKLDELIPQKSSVVAASSILLSSTHQQNSSSLDKVTSDREHSSSFFKRQTNKLAAWQQNGSNAKLTTTEPTALTNLDDLLVKNGQDEQILETVSSRDFFLTQIHVSRGT